MVVLLQTKDVLYRPYVIAEISKAPQLGLVTVLEGHTSWVLSVCFAREGSTVATGSLDLTARVWSVRSGKETRILKGHHASWLWFIAMTEDGKFVSYRWCFSRRSSRPPNLIGISIGFAVWIAHIVLIPFTGCGSKEVCV